MASNVNRKGMCKKCGTVHKRNTKDKVWVKH